MPDPAIAARTSRRSPNRIGPENQSALRRGAIGVWGMVFMVVAATAPLTAMSSNFSLSLGLGAGVGTLGWVVALGLLLLVFTAGYLALARTVVSAGAYQAYVAHGLGAPAGTAIAFIAWIAYNLACAGMIAATGFFADLAMSTYAGVDLPWWFYSIVTLGVVGLLGWFGVDVASRVTTVICVLQFGLLFALAVAVLIQRPSGFGTATQGFTPSAMVSGGFAMTVVFVVLSFGSYEAAASYGEEAHAPGRKITIATCLSLGLLVVVFLVSTWTMVAAFEDVQAEAQSDPGALVVRAADQYLGSFTGAVITVVTVGSFLAAAVAFHNLASRYSFALGRAGLLHGALAKTHASRATPHVAVSLQILLNIVVLTPFVMAGADPLSALFPAVSGVTSLALVAMMTACSISAVVASVRGTLAGSVFTTRVCPAVSAVALIGLGALILSHYGQVTGSASVIVACMPLLLVIGAAFGAVMSVRRGNDGQFGVATASLDTDGPPVRC